MDEPDQTITILVIITPPERLTMNNRVKVQRRKQVSIPSLYALACFHWWPPEPGHTKVRTGRLMLMRDFDTGIPIIDYDLVLERIEVKVDYGKVTECDRDEWEWRVVYDRWHSHGSYTRNQGITINIVDSTHTPRVWHTSMKTYQRYMDRNCSIIRAFYERDPHPEGRWINGSEIPFWILGSDHGIVWYCPMSEEETRLQEETRRTLQRLEGPSTVKGE